MTTAFWNEWTNSIVRIKVALQDYVGFECLWFLENDISAASITSLSLIGLLNIYSVPYYSAVFYFLFCQFTYFNVWQGILEYLHRSEVKLIILSSSKHVV